MTTLWTGHLATPAARRTAAFAASAGTGAVALAEILHYGTPVAQTAEYLAYLLLAVLLPGTLVHKACRGAQETWAADLALGMTTGLCLELVAWATVSFLDIRQLLWAWPVLVLPLLVVRRTRTRVLERPRRPWSVPTSLLVSGGVVVTFVHTARSYFAGYPLPPSGQTYYQDLLWHMGLAWEASRAFPLGTPQVVGDGYLRYHWFSNAHIAVGSMISGVDIPTVTLRLWILPILALMVVLTASLTHRVSGRAWAGGLAAFVVVPTTSYQFWAGDTWTFDHLTPLSPSQVFAMPIMLLVVHALVDLVRDGKAAGIGTWVVVGLGGLANMGAKASSAPVVLGALGVALLASLILRRRRVLLAALVVGAFAMALVAVVAVAGGASGSGWQLFSNFSILPLYRRLVTLTPNLGSHVLTGLLHDHGMAMPVIVGLALITFLAFLRNFAFLLPFVHRELRRDLAAWLLAGTTFAALVPFLVISHSGYSQYYFMYGAIPVGSALLCWAVADTVGEDPVRARVAIGAGLVAASLAALLELRTRRETAPRTMAQWATTTNELVVGVVVGGILLLLLAVGATWWRQRRGSPIGIPLALAIIVAPIAMNGPLEEGIYYATARPSTGRQSTTTATTNVPTSAPVNLADSTAALWIQHHVPLSDLMATNAQCLRGAGLQCDARRWWISGLGGRRVLVSGWRYTPRSAHAPFYDPSLYELNQKTFADPTPVLIAKMKAKGVRWLVGERLPGLPVSPLLSDFGTKRYSNAYVEIYQLQ